MIYMVHFNFNGPRSTRLPETRGIADIEDGFWVNHKLDYTFKLDAEFWIPPSQILYVEKIKGMYA